MKNEQIRVYRVGIHLLIVVGIFAALFTALGVATAVRGDRTVLAVAGAVAIVLFLLLGVLRLQVGPAGFKYRNLSGTHEVAFADVGRAYFEVVRANNAPQGVATFWVERRDRSRVKVNLRTFPIEAAAELLTALESHGIQIEVPDEWAARRVVEQVRSARAKLRGG